MPLQVISQPEVRSVTTVRILIGTKKGAFIATSDGKRQTWSLKGPLFGGWEVYHIKGSPVDPARIYASQSNEWFGQIVQRSDDGGENFYAVDNQFSYQDPVGSHLYYDGSERGFEFKRIWHFEPDLEDPDLVYAGAEDAAIFRSSDGAKSWSELPGLRGHTTGKSWQPGAGGLCLHTIVIDPRSNGRIFGAISAAGVFRSDDLGATWRPVNRGLKSDGIPDPDAEVGHCVHRIAIDPNRPDTLYMQKHWDVMRSDDAGESWYEISGDLPSDFGFVVALHSHQSGTAYVIPISSDYEHFPPQGMLRVYRTTTGGDHWDPLTKGLPQANCYVNVLRDAMDVDDLDPCGIYFGTTSGEIYASSDSGDSWQSIFSGLPAVYSVEVQRI